MGSIVRVSALALFGLVAASQSSAQTAVDFREAVRTAESALLAVSSVAEQPDAAAPGAGPRIEWFDLQGRGIGDVQNRLRQLGVSQERTVTGFAVSETVLIGYTGGQTEAVTVQAAGEEPVPGKVLCVDNVTGLAAIEVEDALFDALVIGSAETEAGMPVVSASMRGTVVHAAAGMVATRPISAGTGFGPSPSIGFAGEAPGVGAPVLDAGGIVVGAMVPALTGGLACVPARQITRLVEVALGEEPADLKRGLVGIQFEGGGPLVMEVSSDSGAAEAGVQAGDVVQLVGDMVIESSADVVAAVAAHRAGDTLELTVKRGGESVVIAVTLKEHPQQRLAQSENGQGGLGWELNNGGVVPLEINPEALTPEAFRDMFRGPRGMLPRRLGPIDGVPLDGNDVEKTLEELQKQMQELNRKLDLDE